MPAPGASTSGQEETTSTALDSSLTELFCSTKLSTMTVTRSGLLINSDEGKLVLNVPHGYWMRYD